MSRQADLRWTLVSWAYRQGHPLSDCIDLVDAVECATENIEYADSELERNSALEDYGYMVQSVTHIFNQLGK